MERNIIEVKENLHVVEVKKNDVVKRYEISALNGYSYRRKGMESAMSGVTIFPASWGLENILADIEIIEN